MLGFLILCLIITLIDYYSYQAIKVLFNSKWIRGSYILLSILIIGFLFFMFAVDRRLLPIQVSNLIVGTFISVYLSKIVMATIIFFEDITRYLKATFNFILNRKSGDSNFKVSSRRSFISKLALGLAALPFSSLLYGMVKGKYNFKVLNYTLTFDDLPESFDGYQITQISDIHSGSFDNEDKIAYAIDLINEQQSDAILFTGDMVNLTASEMQPWKTIFSKLSAKDGLYSVLGNHDYGDYVEWESDEEQTKNLDELKSIHQEIGFDLLLNESRYIKRGDDQIGIIGVENWGKDFRQNGDLDQASKNINPKDFKILLSHDPTHWQEKVIDDKNHYHLTLSGHTHGMQLGIEIPGWIKWSPVKWRYKYWAGIYQEKGQYLNVNRGFGFLAYPGRLGMWPEITVIKLKKKLA